MCITIKIAKEVNLDIVEENKITFNDIDFNYIKANRKITSIEYPIISQYFLVELNNSNIKAFDQDNEFESFKQFQKLLLSKYYFQDRSDLRWNLYLIFIVNEMVLIKNMPIINIENDDNYARKYFLNQEEAVQFLSEKYFKYKNVSSIPVNPISEWIEKLDMVGLSGIISNEYSSSPVNRYIYENEPFNLGGEPLYEFEIIITENDQYQLNYIKEVEIGKFRPHCFSEDEKFRPVHVNLIHGSNGSGKTSILESIEYSLTNSVKRNEDFNDTINIPEITLFGQSENNQKSFKSNQATRVYKEIDRAWYGTPVGRGSCSLNMNFNHFNCFNSESAYKFALEDSKNENNYIDIFTNLIYDQSLLDYQKNINRYQKEFNDKGFEIQKRLNKLEQDLQNCIFEIKNQEISIINGNELDCLLRKLNFINKDLDEDYLKYTKINSILISLESITDRLESNLINLQVNNFSEVTNQKDINKFNIGKIANQIAEISKQNNEENIKIQANLNLIDELKKSSIKNEQLINRMDLLIEVWKKYKLVIDNAKVIKELNTLKSKKHEIIEQINLLKKVEIDYFYIKEMSNDDVVLKNQEENIDNIAAKVTILEGQLSNINEELEARNRINSHQKQVKTQLKALVEIIFDSEKTAKCPLCGEKYRDHMELVRTINDVFNQSFDDELITNLEVKRNSLLSEIQQSYEVINSYSIKQKNIEHVYDVLNILGGHFDYNKNQNISFLLNEAKTIMNSFDALSSQLIIIEEQINTFDEMGFTDDLVENASTFINENSEYIQYRSNETSISFDAYISNRKQNLSEQIFNNQTQVSIAEATIEKSRNLLEFLNTTQLKEELINLKDKEGTINQIIDDYNNCNEFFIINENSNILDFLKGFSAANLKSKILEAQIIEYSNLKLKKENIKLLDQEKDEIHEYLNRCKIACDAINLLPKLNQRVSSFIAENKERIQLLFRALHTPKEFISLDIVENRLVLIREKDKQTIHMHQMSTGQRAALALAVIFVLYLTAEKAPRFLLLDEPVANMDDMHLMNLLDILRSLALNGTQIIFTTANPTVAGIFRRKFSFFGNKFNHFELSRCNLESAEIRTFKYSPEKEVGEILQPVS